MATSINYSVQYPISSRTSQAPFPNSPAQFLSSEGTLLTNTPSTKLAPLIGCCLVPPNASHGARLFKIKLGSDVRSRVWTIKKDSDKESPLRNWHGVQFLSLSLPTPSLLHSIPCCLLTPWLEAECSWVHGVVQLSHLGPSAGRASRSPFSPHLQWHCCFSWVPF